MPDLDTTGGAMSVIMFGLFVQLFFVARGRPWNHHDINSNLTYWSERRVHHNDNERIKLVDI